MLAEIAEPRAELSQYAPRIETIKIPVDKIREVIGTGGKVIRALQEETGATIEIEEDGTVRIAAVEGPAGDAAKAAILAIVKEPEVGEIYEGEVVGIKDFGAFVRLTPSKDGLLHISRMANGRVAKVEDVLNQGDTVKVQVIEIAENGKISLDRIDKPSAPDASPAANGGAKRGGYKDAQRRDRGDRGNRRDSGRSDYRRPRNRS